MASAGRRSGSPPARSPTTASTASIAARFGTGRGRTGRERGAEPESDAGTALALGAFLDGIPEQLVLGIGIAGGAGVSVGLLAAIFVSNLPESIGSSRAMQAGRSRAAGPRAVDRCRRDRAARRCRGYALGDSFPGEMRAIIDGFAAGALIVMLIDSMIPDARKQAGRVGGPGDALGFAVAVALSSVS